MRNIPLRSTRYIPVFFLVAVALISATAFAHARTATGINITVTNSSQKEIRKLYVAVGDPNNWSADQLNGSSITSGNSHTLNNVTCDGSGVRVIAEDQNGCFYYSTVSCDGSATWTITDSSTADCGGAGQ
jgi:hypothetical protein